MIAPILCYLTTPLSLQTISCYQNQKQDNDDLYLNHLKPKLRLQKLELYPISKKEKNQRNFCIIESFVSKQGLELVRQNLEQDSNHTADKTRPSLKPEKLPESHKRKTDPLRTLVQMNIVT